MLATAVTAVASVAAAVVMTTAVAQEDQHQNDNGDQYPVVFETITKTHSFFHLRALVIHLMLG